MLVSDLILDALPRMATAKPTGTTIYQAINYISSMLGKRLLNRGSDLLGTAEMTLVVTPASQSLNLPSGFISLAEKPFDPCRRHREIEPLEQHRSFYEGRTCIHPTHYELLGTQIVFYPAIDPNVVSATVIARYFSLPSQITGPTVTINNVTTSTNVPFNSLFDQAYFQGVPRVVMEGLKVIQADPDFERFLNTEVDTVLNSRFVPVSDRRTSRRTFM